MRAKRFMKGQYQHMPLKEVYRKDTDSLITEKSKADSDFPNNVNSSIHVSKNTQSKFNSNVETLVFKAGARVIIDI